jgi:hypothetical protein
MSLRFHEIAESNHVIQNPITPYIVLKVKG